MKEMQFSIVVLTTLMCSALILLLPGHVKRDAVINRSRWLMFGALALIGVQFLIQYTTQLRALGITQAVLVNLTFFLPASALMSLSGLNLQRQGRIRPFEQWGWFVVWLLVIAILAIAVMMDGKPIEQISFKVRWAEGIASIIYAAMQLYYSMMMMQELKRMKEAIDNYFDHERSGLIRWMKHAIAVTGMMALLVPLLIFSSNAVLIVFALLFFWGIFMMWFCFVRYFTSNALMRVREAEANAEESEREERELKLAGKSGTTEGNGISEVAMQHVNKAVERWLASGGYLKAGITSPIAADAMGIPRYQLTAWVKASGHTSFTRWITALRIEEAKRVLKEHPEWTVEAVADQCGFSRTYFQRIFKQETGMSPGEI